MGPKLETNPKRITRLMQEVTRTQGVYQERDKVMHQIRRMRLLRQRTNMPKAYQNLVGGKRALKLPIMYRLVQTAVSAMIKKPPIVFVEPLFAGDKRAAEDQAHVDGLLLQTVEYVHRTPFLVGLAFTLLGDGMGVVKTLPGPWAGYPLQNPTEETAPYNERVRAFVHDHPLPFYTKIVDPLTFYPPLDEYGEGAVVESGWRSSWDVLRTLKLKGTGNKELTLMAPDEVPAGRPYPTDELPAGMPPAVKVDEVWTRDSCAVIVDNGRAVLLYENPLGELPYEWGYADPTGVQDPTNIGMSIAFPLYALTPWIDTILGITAAWALWAPPTVYTTQDPVPGQGRMTQEIRSESIELGKMYHFPVGKKPGVLAAPPVGQHLLGLLSFLVDAGDRGGLPAIASGAGVGTRMPALTFQSVMEAGTDRLRPARESLERVLGGTVMKWHKIVGRYDTPVKVNGYEYTSSGETKSRRWATLTPEEARKGRRVQISIPMDSTQDMIAKGTHAQFMVSAGLWDVERAMRFAGVENPQETLDKIAGDTARRAALPLIAQAVLAQDEDIQAEMERAAAAEMGGGDEGGAGGSELAAAAAGAGAPPGPGRNRQGVPPGRGGGANARPTQRPRGNRGGTGKQYGRT